MNHINAKAPWQVSKFLRLRFFFPWFALSVLAHPASIPNPVGMQSPASIPPNPVGTQSPASPISPPSSPKAIPVPPLPSVSPVEQFRELLAMNTIERRRFLAERPEATRKQILAKIREYESLKPEQRELRLKATELRWWLMPLMRTPAKDRAAQLGMIPADSRELVDSRLREWDKLSPAVQKELLDNEATLRYFAETEGPSASYPAARRQKLDAGIAQWQTLPEARRREIAHRFEQFFGLTNPEKEKVLRTVSDAERRQIEKTLKSFGSLPAQQRAQCIRSFGKLASLTPAERQQFLKNAERWQLMTPSERQDWRNLVARLSSQPPLPFDALQQAPVPSPPPLPTSARRPLATN